MTRHGSVKHVQSRTPPLILEHPMLCLRRISLLEADSVDRPIVTSKMIGVLVFCVDLAINTLSSFTMVLVFYLSILYHPPVSRGRFKGWRRAMQGVALRGVKG